MQSGGTKEGEMLPRSREKGGRGGGGPALKSLLSTRIEQSPQLSQQQEIIRVHPLRGTAVPAAWGSEGLGRCAAPALYPRTPGSTHQLARPQARLVAPPIPRAPCPLALSLSASTRGTPPTCRPSSRRASPTPLLASGFGALLWTRPGVRSRPPTAPAALGFHTCLRLGWARAPSGPEFGGEWGQHLLLLEGS